jgi:hypothetical protein
MPRTDERSLAISAEVTQEFNKMVDSGAITGVDKIPVVETVAETSTVPVASPAVVTPTVTPAPAPVTTPETGKVFNKYSDLKEAERGYYNVVNTLSTTLDESAKKDEEITRLRSQLAATPRVDQDRERVNPVTRNPIDWSKAPAVEKTSEVSGIPVEILADFAEMVTRTATENANQNFQDTLAPLKAEAEAEAYMRENYPDALNHTKEVTNFIKANPRIAKTVGALIRSGEPAAAMEHAWTMYTIDTGIGIETKMKANSEVAEAERAKARASAGLPSSPTTPVHSANAGTPPPTAEEIEFLKDKAKGGDEKAKILLRRIFAGHLLPPALRTWEQT